MPTVSTTDLASTDAWERRRIRIGREIERAALTLLAESDSVDVTVEQLAMAAGVSVRTFFRYFPSRDDVMTGVPEREVARMCARVAARPSSEGVLDAFSAAMREPESDSVDDDLIRLWGRAIQRAGVTKLSPAPGSNMVQQYGQVIALRLRLPADDARVEVAAAAIAGVMWLAFMRWLFAEDQRSLVEVLDECLNLLRSLDSDTGPDGRPRPTSNGRRQA